MKRTKKGLFPMRKSLSDREIRDLMNGIRRDKDGKMTHIHGKPVVKKEVET